MNLDRIERIRGERPLGDMSELLLRRAQFVDVSGDVIHIGKADELSPEEHQSLLRSIKFFMPWKKGPFSLYGQHIDSEWKSELKWNRVLNQGIRLRGKRIADIGSHNGYYMFRMAAQQPSEVVGFEPVERPRRCFEFLKNHSGLENLRTEPLGIEHIHYYEGYFHTVFCMGILYHHRDPIGLLRKIWKSLRNDGEVIVECQGIPGTDPIALLPRGRYAHGRGVWFLPTVTTLMNWLLRTGFCDIECFENAPLSADEQRTSSHAPIKSFKDFLDPNDPTKTVEGYPAPVRIYVRARKK